MASPRAGSLALVALLLSSACSAGSTPMDSAAASPAGSATVPSPPPTATGAAFFLHLPTGEVTPLASTSTEDFGSGSPFNEGHYYAVSPDGSVIYWEDSCCRGKDVAMEASMDAAQGRRVDPVGPLNHYAGGWSPDGTKFVYQQRDGIGDDVGNLFVEDRASGRTTRVTDLAQRTRAEHWYLAPTFSPDSRNVIFQWPQDTPDGPQFALWSVPVTGGTPSLLHSNAAQAATSRAPSYAFVRPIGKGFDGSHLVITTTAGVRTLVEAEVGIFEPKMSPDGSRIAYADGSAISVVDVTSGERSTVAVGRMATWVDDETLIVAPRK